MSRTQKTNRSTWRRILWYACWVLTLSALVVTFILLLGAMLADQFVVWVGLILLLALAWAIYLTIYALCDRIKYLKTWKDE